MSSFALIFLTGLSSDRVTGFLWAIAVSIVPRVHCWMIQAHTVSEPPLSTQPRFWCRLECCLACLPDWLPGRA